MAATLSESYSQDLAATTFKRLHPTAYLKRFFHSGIREDARPILSFRTASISLGSISTADGSCFVKIGNTACVAAIKAQVATPHLSRPDQGYLIPNVELPAICSASFKPGAPGDEAQVLTDRLLSFLNSSKVLDPTQLCIQPQLAAWCLYLDISFISFDGNAMDAAVLSAVGALRNTTLPQATYNVESGETIASRSQRQKLALKTIPLCASFGTFEESYLISDPSAFESSLLASHLCIGIQVPSSTESKEMLCFISHSGNLRTGHPGAKGGAFSSDQDNFDLCVKLARARCTQLRQLLVDAEKSASDMTD